MTPCRFRYVVCNLDNHAVYLLVVNEYGLIPSSWTWSNTLSVSLAVGLCLHPERSPVFQNIYNGWRKEVPKSHPASNTSLGFCPRRSSKATRVIERADSGRSIIPDNRTTSARTLQCMAIEKKWRSGGFYAGLHSRSAVTINLYTCSQDVPSSNLGGVILYR